MFRRKHHPAGKVLQSSLLRTERPEQLRRASLGLKLCGVEAGAREQGILNLC